MSTDQPTPPEGGGEERELTQEEMVAAEMLRRLMTTPVQDVVFQTMATFTDMAAIRMGLGPRGDEDFDLPQAGLAIESLRALLAVANAIMGEEAAKPFAEPLAQLQMAFAELVEQAKAAKDAKKPKAEVDALYAKARELRAGAYKMTDDAVIAANPALKPLVEKSAPKPRSSGKSPEAKPATEAKPAVEAKPAA